MGPQDDKHARLSNDPTVDSFEAEGADQAHASTEETVDSTEWSAEAEGYTPLADATMNAFAGGMFMAMPPAEEGDSGVFFADMGAFPSAQYASIAHQYDSDDTDSNNETFPGPEDPFSTITEAIDISLAEQALRALDEEYSMTVKGQVLDPSERDVGEAMNVAPPSAAPVHHDDSDEKISFADAEFDATRPVTSTFPTLNLFQTPKKDLPPIDTDAVKRAVAAIQLKAPKLNSNLNKWQQEHCDILAPKDHPIIPQLPLTAFRKRTAKAKKATANLSRAATIADALDRISCLQGQDILTIHVIGADCVECGSKDTLQTLFGPLVRWVGAIESQAPKSIQIHLIGPNLANSSIPPVDLMPSSKLKKTSPLDSAWATCHGSAYHHWAATSTSWTVPALLIAFNAGIWGYSDWRPTLEALCCVTWEAPLVVTSYTIQEAEDDADVMSEIIAACGKENSCLWPVELNPYSSRMTRETATAIEGREYRENAAWQAWCLGSMTLPDKQK